jgi:hypothetical protein
LSGFGVYQELRHYFRVANNPGIAQENAFVGTNPHLTFTFECPSSSRNRALALANFAGVSRPCFGFFGYRGWPRRRLHSPLTARINENRPVTPSA